VEKIAPKICDPSEFFKKVSQTQQSPNRRKFAQSGPNPMHGRELQRRRCKNLQRYG
jgi:hypothetical protein